MHSSSSGTDPLQATPAAEATRQASLPPTLVVEEIEHAVRHHLVEQLDLNEKHVGAFLFLFTQKKNAAGSHTTLLIKRAGHNNLLVLNCNQR